MGPVLLSLCLKAFLFVSWPLWHHSLRGTSRWSCGRRCLCRHSTVQRHRPRCRLSELHALMSLHVRARMPKSQEMASAVAATQWVTTTGCCCYQSLTQSLTNHSIWRVTPDSGGTTTILNMTGTIASWVSYCTSTCHDSSHDHDFGSPEPWYSDITVSYRTH